MTTSIRDICTNNSLNCSHDQCNIRCPNYHPIYKPHQVDPRQPSSCSHREQPASAPTKADIPQLTTTLQKLKTQIIITNHTIDILTRDREHLTQEILHQREHHQQLLQQHLVTDTTLAQLDGRAKSKATAPTKPTMVKIKNMLKHLTKEELQSLIEGASE